MHITETKIKETRDLERRYDHVMSSDSYESTVARMFASNVLHVNLLQVLIYKAAGCKRPIWVYLENHVVFGTPVFDLSQSVTETMIKELAIDHRVFPSQNGLSIGTEADGILVSFKNNYDDHVVVTTQNVGQHTNHCKSEHVVKAKCHKEDHALLNDVKEDRSEYRTEKLRRSLHE